MQIRPKHTEIRTLGQRTLLLLGCNPRFELLIENDIGRSCLGLQAYRPMAH